VDLSNEPVEKQGKVISPTSTKNQSPEKLVMSVPIISSILGLHSDATSGPRRTVDDTQLGSKKKRRSRVTTKTLATGAGFPGGPDGYPCGAASALAFVAAGFGVAVVSEPLQRIPAENVICRGLAA
jgi:hypothetical protein